MHKKQRLHKLLLNLHSLKQLFKPIQLLHLMSLRHQPLPRSHLLKLLHSPIQLFKPLLSKHQQKNLCQLKQCNCPSQDQFNTLDAINSIMPDGTAYKINFEVPEHILLRDAEISAYMMSQREMIREESFKHDQDVSLPLFDLPERQASA